MPVISLNGKKISIYTMMSFLVTLALCICLVGVMIINRSIVEELTMEQLIQEKSADISDTVSKLLYKTQILSALIFRETEEPQSFEQIAGTVIDDSVIVNILIAPGGVVSDVYPLKGNEAVIGLDLLSEGAGNKEAVLAKETGMLVLGGPFESVQGGQVLVGRLPIFLDNPDGSKQFWGFVSVTLRYPQALEAAGLSQLKLQGFAYEVWRVNPDDGQRQIIATSNHDYNENTRYVEKHIPIMNANWYFRILPVRAWHQFPETWASVFISVCISVLVAVVTHNNQELKRLKIGLEELSSKDSLTGIYNRRFFLESAEKQMDKILRSGNEAFVIMLDLDHFKKVNDEYRHRTGDRLLKEIADCISGNLRSYDLFARYGGEEFVILISDLDKPSVISLAERLRLGVAETKVDVDGTFVSVTASFGIASTGHENKLKLAIQMADDALYRAKEQGRNQVVFHEGEDA